MTLPSPKYLWWWLAPLHNEDGVRHHQLGKQELPSRGNPFNIHLHEIELTTWYWLTFAILLIILLFSFLLGGVIIYWHWEAMLISNLATRVTPLPFHDLRGLHDSDYSLFVYPGSAVWDTVKFGDGLRQDIFKAKLEPYQGRPIIMNTQGGMNVW